MQAFVRTIEYYLPEQILTNAQLKLEFPDWNIDKIAAKVGITERHIAAENECASDLAVAAAQKLFDSQVCQPENIDYILFCTQSPDYFLPTTACIIQERLGIPKTAGALDFNLGCSGFVYGLSLAKGLIETEQAQNILLITADTYSKFIDPDDRNVRTIFGDAAAVTLVQGVVDTPQSLISPFVFGTDGSGANNLIVPTGGMRQRYTNSEVNVDKKDNLYMDGTEIFNFTLQVVPDAVNNLLAKAGKIIDDIDLFIFHQANQYMLEHLRKKLKLPDEKFYIKMQHCGNTVSSTIPIAIKHAYLEGKLKTGSQLMLVGFGVGYSWGAVLVKWI